VCICVKETVPGNVGHFVLVMTSARGSIQWIPRVGTEKMMNPSGVVGPPVSERADRAELGDGLGISGTRSAKSKLAMGSGLPGRASVKG
jgi:hypothetical protein